MDSSTKFRFRIAAHRVILFSASAYLKALFETPLKEKDQSVFKVPVGTGDVLEQVVDFCYRNEIAINDHNVDALLMVASYLQITELETKCAQFLKDTLRTTNCLGIWKIAEQYALNDLKCEAIEYTARYITDVIECDEFNLLGSVQLAEILKSDALKVNAEEELFKALVGWTRYDREEREDSFRMLVEHIRFQHVRKSVSSTLFASVLAFCRHGLRQERISEICVSHSFSIVFSFLWNTFAPPSRSSASTRSCRLTTSVY